MSACNAAMQSVPTIAARAYRLQALIDTTLMCDTSAWVLHLCRPPALAAKTLLQRNRAVCWQAGAKEDEVCQLQATLTGAQYKLAAYKRENEKLADGAEAAKAEITGACGTTPLTFKRPRSVCT